MPGQSYQTMANNSGLRDEEGGTLAEAEALLGKGTSSLKGLWNGFVEFAFSGNILQIAFGLILATTFTDFIKSFVSDVLMPPISALLPINKNMEEKFAILQPGDHYDPLTGYNTLLQAKEDGALVLAYGSFINQIISFGMTGVALYGLAHFYSFISHDSIIKHTTKCTYCRQVIGVKAQRCLHCTSWLDGREEKGRSRGDMN